MLEATDSGVTTESLTFLVGTAVAQMALVLPGRSIDVVNVEIATIHHLDIDRPGTAITPRETDLPGDFTLFH